MQNRLNIVAVEEKRLVQPNDRLARRQEAEARFDRLWLIAPEQMDPMRHVMEKERIARTLALIDQQGSLKGKKGVDLGCGKGVLALQLRDKGVEIDAVDISSNALKPLHNLSQIHPIQDYVPTTRLKDDAYDIVLCTELIGYLPRDEHRLLISEIARLVKADGIVVCSSSLDIDSFDAVQQFTDLMETELKIESWRFSYHLCWIRLKDLFSAPAHYVKARRDPEYRQKALQKRRGISRHWFSFNSRPLPALVWSLLQLFANPIVKLLKTNHLILLKLEKFCRFFWSDAGISHAILLGRRRPLFVPPPAKELPRETKHKKQLWE
jgi:2-polyprenyl-3-methyl-5-hydroxy-6-metoxy-1,4-benzoquinol methylase